jgi:hypothetical protein
MLDGQWGYSQIAAKTFEVSVVVCEICQAVVANEADLAVHKLMKHAPEWARWTAGVLVSVLVPTLVKSWVSSGSSKPHGRPTPAKLVARSRRRSGGRRG